MRVIAMLKNIRQGIVKKLWETYREQSSQASSIEAKLQEKGINQFILDHFAVIDLPGPHTGIPQLSQIFSHLGYTARGKGYLPDKQNDFLWMAESDSDSLPAKEVLPQVVTADFRLDEMPIEIRKIIEKYSQQAKTSPLPTIQHLLDRAKNGDIAAAEQLELEVLRYLQGREWPLPTVAEFNLVQEFNELLAWVLVFGRKPNHFTVSVHLLDHFTDLAHFHDFIENEVQLELNRDGGVIKGGEQAGIAQGSTLGSPQAVKLIDGTIHVPTAFVEFVWRYPNDKAVIRKPGLWQDFFTDFVAQHANHVIESLYSNPQ